MPGISTVGKNVAGGPIVGPGEPTWTIDGKPIALLGDAVTPHGLPPHSAPVMAEGSSWFTIDGVPVVCAGKKATCGHGADGESWFTIAP